MPSTRYFIKKVLWKLLPQSFTDLRLVYMLSGVYLVQQLCAILPHCTQYASTLVFVTTTRPAPGYQGNSFGESPWRESPKLWEGWNVFWIFVVTMMLNTKSLLIATKYLVFFFAQKSINNLLHQMFFCTVCVCNVWPSEIPWFMDKRLTEGWWWYSETSEITVLCSKQTQRHFWSVLSCSKKHSTSCL